VRGAALQSLPKHWHTALPRWPRRGDIFGPLMGPSAVLWPAVAVRPMAVLGSAGSAGPGGVTGFWQCSCFVCLSGDTLRRCLWTCWVDVLPCMGVGGGRWTRHAKSTRAPLHTSRGSLSLCDERVQARVTALLANCEKKSGRCVTRGYKQPNRLPAR